MGARCSWWATRCSRSTASATRKSACSCRARRAGIGALALTPLRLRRNFRTVPDLVGFNNALFAAIFPRAR